MTADKLRRVAATRKTEAQAGTWAERRIHAALAAFEKLTGKRAVDTPEAWKVFWEAMRAAAEPTAARTTWLVHATKPFRATEGVRKSRILLALWGTATDAASYRNALQQFDPLFAKATDAAIRRAFVSVWERRATRPPVALANTERADRLGWFEAIAEVAVTVGALGAPANVTQTSDKISARRTLAHGLSQNFSKYRTR